MQLRRRQNLLNAEKYIENPSLETLAGILPMYLNIVKYYLDNRRSKKAVNKRVIGYAVGRVTAGWYAFVDLACLGVEYHDLLKTVSNMIYGEGMPIENLPDFIGEAYQRVFSKEHNHK